MPPDDFRQYVVGFSIWHDWQLNFNMIFLKLSIFNNQSNPPIFHRLRCEKRVFCCSQLKGLTGLDSPKGVLMWIAVASSTRRSIWSTLASSVLPCGRRAIGHKMEWRVAVLVAGWFVFVVGRWLILIVVNTPQKSNIDSQKGHISKESPFPRPIILVVTTLDGGKSNIFMCSPPTLGRWTHFD